MASQENILVIGGGISGLACAWRLRKLGLPVLLLERSPRFGGLISTVEKNGFRFDVGPQSFLAGESLLALIQELSLAGELCKADSKAPRYILHSGRLVRAPLGPASLLRTPLLGWKTKLRLLSEPFRHSHPPADDESIAAFVRRKFGTDILENLVAPFVSGVYAGDPEKLSLASAFPSLRQFEERHGSVIRGAMKSRREASATSAPLYNFRQGIVTLTEALGSQLGDSARRGVEVLDIQPRSAGASTDISAKMSDGFKIACREDGTVHSLNAAAVILATPTSQAAQLLTKTDPRFAEALAQIEYVGVAQVSAGYRLSQISPPGVPKPLAGFGFLVPRSERLRLLGTVWNSLLFPERAPDGPEKLAVFTSFLGGATDPDICRLSEDEIACTARTELATAMAISDSPIVERVARWERALPQYNLGHARIVATLGELCRKRPGIFLAGNYLAGPSLPVCVEQANRTAEEVAQFCAAPPSPNARP